MFGISFAEFFVIILVAIFVIPAKNWPDVARFLAGIVKFIRGIIWKITDAGEQIKNQIELEKPINDLLKNTADDIISSFSSAVKKSPKIKKSNIKSGVVRKK